MWNCKYVSMSNTKILDWSHKGKSSGPSSVLRHTVLELPSVGKVSRINLFTTKHLVSHFSELFHTLNVAKQFYRTKTLKLWVVLQNFSCESIRGLCATKLKCSPPPLYYFNSFPQESRKRYNQIPNEYSTVDLPSFQTFKIFML